MSRPFRPSNGTMGACFHEDWCCRCARDACMNGSKEFDDCDDSELCPIIAATYAYDITDPKYPKEWNTDEDGPRCTAFVLKGEPIPPPADTFTLPLELAP